ncbi:hypothetical protein [Desulfatirhabdium butyrativorans]|uniref:hypothetical protein n=1 Tax=Desulfatirhabdium butyrativorans TaxID=340467 RepID=UPI0004129B55|nr:hypothetical protein [Desulfatirhabdium butyrativorans]
MAGERAGTWVRVGDDTGYDKSGGALIAIHDGWMGQGSYDYDYDNDNDNENDNDNDNENENENDSSERCGERDFHASCSWRFRRLWQ